MYQSIFKNKSSDSTTGRIILVCTLIIRIRKYIGWEIVRFYVSMG